MREKFIFNPDTDKACVICNKEPGLIEVTKGAEIKNCCLSCCKDKGLNVPAGVEYKNDNYKQLQLHKGHIKFLIDNCPGCFRQWPGPCKYNKILWLDPIKAGELPDHKVCNFRTVKSP